MQKLKRKDNTARKKLKRGELKNNILKNLQYNDNLLLNLKFKAFDQILIQFDKTKSKTAINNRCLQTISKKALNKKFKLSRIEFLRLVRGGHVCGFQKAVW